MIAGITTFRQNNFELRYSFRRHKKTAKEGKHLTRILQSALADVAFEQYPRPWNVGDLLTNYQLTIIRTWPFSHPGHHAAIFGIEQRLRRRTPFECRIWKTGIDVGIREPNFSAVGQCFQNLPSSRYLIECDP